MVHVVCPMMHGRWAYGHAFYGLWKMASSSVSDAEKENLGPPKSKCGQLSS